MSDLMLLGALRAPTPEPDNPLGIAQLADRARQAADELERLRALADQLDAENEGLREERDDFRKECVRLGCEAAQLRERADRLTEFVAEIYKGWPEPAGVGLDEVDLTELGMSYRILLKQNRMVPCTPDCACLPFQPEDTWVDCFLLRDEFKVTDDGRKD